MLVEIISGMIAAIVGLAMLAVGPSVIKRLLLRGSYWINSGLALCVVIGFYSLFELSNGWVYPLAEQLFGAFIVATFALAILFAHEVRTKNTRGGGTTSQPQSEEKS